jgi:hypothetical protein
MQQDTNRIVTSLCYPVDNCTCSRIAIGLLHLCAILLTTAHAALSAQTSIKKHEYFNSYFHHYKSHVFTCNKFGFALLLMTKKFSP